VDLDGDGMPVDAEEGGGPDGGDHEALLTMPMDVRRAVTPAGER
jgi:hypothetical protein